MWKMYLRSAHGGGSSEFWDAEWEGGQLGARAENDRICQNQGAVFRAITRAVQKDRLFLEGGCGMAAWVRYFHHRGQRAMGIDFAEKTVARVNAFAPEVDVRRGDITAMPLADGSVHTYYSGGVVEHFERGPEAPLREARRVMADDGWFLCSVPDASLLRTRLLYPLQRWRKTSNNASPEVRKVADTLEEAATPGSTFYQYLFERDEFVARLHASGFRVDSDFGCFLMWGLREVPGIQWSLDRLGRMRPATKAAASVADVEAVERPGASGSQQPEARGGAFRRLLERIALQEDTTVPGIGPSLAWALERCSNMRMYVARPR